MPREPIPEEVRRFVLTSVPSVPYAEALVLCRELRTGLIDGDLLMRRLYVTASAATDLLARLQDAGLVVATPEGPLVLASPPPELAAMLDTFATFYRSQLVEMTDLIHRRSARKAQQFADAFKLRKEP
jgi:hypothetical protein